MTIHHLLHLLPRCRLLILSATILPMLPRLLPTATNLLRAAVRAAAAVPNTKI